MIHSASRWLLLLVPLLLLSCTSTGFEQRWKDAQSASSHRASPDITGAWLGTWRSDVNGHHGVLRCVVSHEDSKSESYRFHYHATYGTVLSAAYVVTEQVRRQGDHFVLSGDHDLGYLAGGLYHYEGTSTVKAMKSSYRSSADHGVFELARP